MRARRRGILLEAKIQELGKLKKIISGFKKSRKKIVFTNGCFDLLHFGHVKYLKDAKAKGDILVVGVNSDASVKKIKGEKRPIVKQSDRIRVIAALESVDFAVLFAEETPIKVIKAIRPDILVKGADWNRNEIVGSDFVQSYSGKVLRIKLVKGHSTTDLIKKIAKVQ